MPQPQTNNCAFKMPKVYIYYPPNVTKLATCSTLVD